MDEEQGVEAGAERGGPGQKGRQPKWARQASEACVGKLKSEFIIVNAEF